MGCGIISLMKNTVTWPWVAGFFEGEGNIAWYKGRKGTKQGTSGRIIIGQKDKRPLVAIVKFLALQGFTHTLLYLRPAKPPKKPNPIWILGINQREEVIKFLDAIAPMLFEKQKKAVLVRDRLGRLNQERIAILDAALQERAEGKTWREIARHRHITWTTLTNYARAQGIELRKAKFDFTSWRAERITRGLCASCGESRGDNGTKTYCRSCADKVTEASKKWKIAHRQQPSTA